MTPWSLHHYNCNSCPRICFNNWFSFTSTCTGILRGWYTHEMALVILILYYFLVETFASQNQDQVMNLQFACTNKTILRMLKDRPCKWVQMWYPQICKLFYNQPSELSHIHVMYSCVWGGPCMFDCRMIVVIFAIIFANEPLSIQFTGTAQHREKQSQNWLLLSRWNKYFISFKLRWTN